MRYAVDKYEVTNSQFKKFIDANPQWQKKNWWNPKAGIDDKYHDGDYLKTGKVIIFLKEKVNSLLFM